MGRPSAAEIERVITALGKRLESDQPMTVGQLRSCVPETEVMINVALDQMQTSERVSRRIIGGRIVYFLPDWTPPKPGRRATEARLAATHIQSTPGISTPAAQPIEATLDWHAASAEREAQRRNAAPTADFPLPDAMSNTGEWEPEATTELAATSALIEDAKFAIWSDGRLEIDAGDTHLTLSQATTRRLFGFLDQFSSIEAH